MTCKCPNCGCEFAQEKPFVPWETKNHATITARPAGAGSLHAVARRLWETFDRRASRWQSDEGELGDVVSTELRTLNQEWLEMRERTQEKPPSRVLNEPGSHNELHQG